MILSSARRHQITDSGILHAWRNPIDAWELDEDLTMLVGPSRSAQMLEIGVVNSEEGSVIVHAGDRPTEVPQEEVTPDATQYAADT